MNSKLRSCVCYCFLKNLNRAHLLPRFATTVLLCMFDGLLPLRLAEFLFILAERIFNKLLGLLLSIPVSCTRVKLVQSRWSLTLFTDIIIIIIIIITLVNF